MILARRVGAQVLDACARNPSLVRQSATVVDDTAVRQAQEHVPRRLDNRATLPTLQRFDQLITHGRTEVVWAIVRDSFEEVGLVGPAHVLVEVCIRSSLGPVHRMLTQRIARDESSRATIPHWSRTC